MAYQEPKLMFRHLLRSAGIGALTSSTPDASFPLARLIDDQIQPLFKFNVSAANQHVTVDTTALASSNADSLTIPAGHNLDGATLELRGSADPASWPGTLIRTWVQSGSGVIQQNVGSTTFDHWRLQIVTAGQWQFSELVLTQRRTLSLGPDPQFSDQVAANFGQRRMLSGEVYRNVRGPAQRVIELAWERLDTTAQGILDLLGVETLEGVLPLWIESPYDDRALIPVRIEGGIPRIQDHPVPQSAIEERLALRLVEAVE